MRIAIVVLALLVGCMPIGCTGLTTQTSVNTQWDKDGQTPEFVQSLLIGLDMPAEAVAKLSPEQLSAIYLAMAQKGLAGPSTITFSPTLEFHQSNGSEGETSAQVSAEVKAQLEATMRDLITNPAP